MGTDLLPGRACAAVLIVAAACGPKQGAEEPGDDDRLELIPSPDVAFPDNLDIALEIPDDPGTLPSPDVIWRAGGASALGIAGHVVILVDDREGRVEARDVQDGGVIWEAGVPACPVCAFRLNPVFDGERVIVSSGSRLVALDARDGSEHWTLDLTGLPDGPGTLLDGRILVLRTLERASGLPCGSVTTRILFVDTRTGSPLWRIEYVGHVAEFAVVAGFLHVFLIGGCDTIAGSEASIHSLRIYRLADREVVDETLIKEPLSLPVVAAGHILVEFPTGLVAMVPGSSDAEWSTQPGGSVAQAFVPLEDELVFVGDKCLSLLAAGKGTTLWNVDLSGVSFRQGLNVLPTVAVTSTYILAPMEPDPLRGYLVVFDRQTGKVRRLFRGFGPVFQTLAWGGTGILLLGDEVVAVDLVGEGTPERDLVPVPAAVTRLVLDLEEDIPFVPWSAAAEEVERLGDEGVETLLAMATQDGSLVAALIAARILASAPRPECVPRLLEFLSIPPPGSGDLVHVHGRMLYETIRALTAAADPSSTEALAGIIRDEGLDQALRSAALAALGAVAASGHGPAAEAVTAYRSSREKAVAGGWSPCPLPPSLFEFDGPFRVAGSVCKMGVDTPFSSSRSVSTPDGEWLAYVSPALGGRNDVWLARIAAGTLDGPWFTGRTVPGQIELQFLDLIDDGTLVLESVERECEGCYLEEEDRPVSGKPDETPLDPALLARDTDKDGWPDPVEQRLGTSPKKKDTDGDGRGDSKDPAPLSSSKPKPSDRQEVLAAAVFTLLGFGDSDEPLFVVGSEAVNISYTGYAAALMHVSPERARAIQKSLGLPGPAFLAFGCPIDDQGNLAPGCVATGEKSDKPLDFIMMSKDGSHASLSLSLYRSATDAALYRVEVTQVAGTWMVTRFELAGFF